MKLWKELFTKLGSPEELQAKLESNDTPDGARARERVHPDQSASANAVETADQAGGNRGCHLLYGNERRRQ